MTAPPDLVAEINQIAEQQTSNGHDEHQADSIDHPRSAVERLDDAVITTSAIRALPPPEWLIEGYLARNSLAMLYGPSGTYKTFAALDIVLHAATGSWWNGHEITAPARTLYVIAEGVSGIGARLDAWQAHHNIYDLDRPGYAPIAWIPRAVNIADRLEAAALAQVAERLEPDLIVIDTLARCTLGAEENSAKDMGLVVEHLDLLRRTTGACVLSVHHTGKDAASGARGSSALRAAMDTEIELAPEPLEMRVTKQKDAPEAARLRLAPLPVQLDNDTSSVVLVPTSIIAQGDEIGSSDAIVLAALEDIVIPGGVAAGAWEKASGVAGRTFYRSRGRLLGRGLVINLGTEKQPRYAPAQAASDGNDI